MKFLVPFFSLIFFNSFHSLAQPAIQWQRSYGGTFSDYTDVIHQTSDNGYIVAGNSESEDGDLLTNYGGSDCWIMKLDNIGNIQWKKTLGAAGEEFTGTIIPTNDQGYIMIATTSSFSGSVTGNHGMSDIWVVKLSSTGSVQWKKCFGGTESEHGSSIRQTVDGGYIIGGSSESDDGDLTFNQGVEDCWIIKIDSIGAIQWQRTFGGSRPEYSTDLIPSADGGYMVFASSYSLDGDITNHHGDESNPDVWILKINSVGILQWQKSFGGSSIDEIGAVQPTLDGGYLLACSAFSSDGDCTSSQGRSDFWIVKIDSIGVIQWQKSYGGADYDYANGIALTNDGGYIVAGQTLSTDGDVSGHHGISWNSDYWVLKLDSAGSVKWKKCFGGSHSDYAFSVVQTNDGGYAIAGAAESEDGDITNHHFDFSFTDGWILKLNPDPIGINEENFPSNFQMHYNFLMEEVSISSAVPLEGKTHMSIINVIGVKVFQSEFTYPQTWVNVSALTPGLYFVNLEGSDNITWKLFKD